MHACESFKMCQSELCYFTERPADYRYRLTTSTSTKLSASYSWTWRHVEGCATVRTRGSLATSIRRPSSVPTPRDPARRRQRSTLGRQSARSRRTLPTSGRHQIPRGCGEAEVKTVSHIRRPMTSCGCKRCPH